MGRRYSAILKELGVDYTGVDKGDEFPEYDKAIICTPTPLHMEACMAVAAKGKNFLCEKPISKDPQNISRLIEFCDKMKVDGRMVCNWAFAGKYRSSAKHVYYNNYHTGNDGFYWDTIQLTELGGDVILNKDASVFEAAIDFQRITLQDIAKSYFSMIEAWIEQPKKLWSLNRALHATEKIIDTYSSPDHFQEIPRQST